MAELLDPGSVFAGRYRIVRAIATGGMGSVYEVVHLETERRRALKVMLPEMLRSPELRQRFQREARIAGHVDSEFIVDVFDAGVDEATQMPFLVMELLRGEDLAVHLEHHGRFSFADTVTFLHQASLALDKTHRASIVHRDLKPENLFLTEREDGAPRIKILDFGIAKVLSAAGAAATRALGTPLYMAPEQFKDGSTVSAATDIYALGMMAYTFLVGVPYWLQEIDGAADVFVFAGVAVKGPVEPATVRAARFGVTLPYGFNLWFARATALDPAERFTLASAAAIELADALGVPGPAGRSGAADAPTQVMGLDPRPFALTSPLATGGSLRLPLRRFGPLPFGLAAGLLVALAGWLLFRRVLSPPPPAPSASAATSPASGAPASPASGAPEAPAGSSPGAPVVPPAPSASTAPSATAIAAASPPAGSVQPAAVRPSPRATPRPPKDLPPAKPTYSRD